MAADDLMQEPIMDPATRKMLAHISRQQDETTTVLKGLRDDITEIKTAFPANDLDGHRRAHEAMIEDVEARKRLTEAIKEKTISGLVWAMLVGTAMAMWSYVVTKIKGG